MNYTTINIYRQLLFVFLIFCLIGLSLPIFAEPYLAVRTESQCSTCHVNPTGGGARNAYGNYFGSHVLPEKPGSNALFDPGLLGDTVRIGADMRANFSYEDADESENAQGFETQSAQLYFHLKPQGMPFSLYIDQQVAPGAAINRESFVLFQLGDKHYLKAGKIFLPYGLRLEDDSALVRQATQFNFDNSDNGVELGLTFDKIHLQTAISNGTSATTNDDNKLQTVTRLEYAQPNWRVGGNLALNSSEAGDRQTHGVYLGANIYGFTVLAEWDQIRDESIQNSLGDNIEQEVIFMEANRLLKKGLNLKLTYEELNPDINIENNERSRVSALAEYTPYANLQLRGGIRVSDDIPQRPQSNSTMGFIQAHLYF